MCLLSESVRFLSMSYRALRKFELQKFGTETLHHIWGYQVQELTTLSQKYSEEERNNVR
jgi:hypothetical protein